MAQHSAGLLVYRIRNNHPEVFLAHPGGPFFKNKDKGAWTIPKGLPEKGENLEEAAFREFGEETGVQITKENKPLIELGTVTQKGGKIVHAWAIKADIPEDFELKSNCFEMEFPPKSGRKQQFPEVDKASFFNIKDAREKINPAQQGFIDRLLEHLES